MKHASVRFAIPLLFLVLAGFGCDRPSPASKFPGSGPSSAEVARQAFGAPVTLRIGRSVTFVDGLTVRLNKIEDTRCPANVECIWQGELSPRLTVSGGDLPTAQELTLGTVRAPLASANGYGFSLRSVSEEFATIIVTKASAEAPVPENMIRVASPKSNQVVENPLVVTGEARGNWYFEASFPVKLVDANGNLLAQAPAQAQGDWMTTEFVPFTVTLNFTSPSTPTGTLILEKDNPSGLPENDDSRSISVRFAP